MIDEAAASKTSCGLSSLEETKILLPPLNVRRPIRPSTLYASMPLLGNNNTVTFCNRLAFAIHYNVVVRWLVSGCQWLITTVVLTYNLESIASSKIDPNSGHPREVAQQTSHLVRLMRKNYFPAPHQPYHE